MNQKLLISPLTENIYPTLIWIFATLFILECYDDIQSVFLCSEVLKACMSESGMKFDDGEVQNLAKALFDDAVKVSMQTAALIPVNT